MKVRFSLTFKYFLIYILIMMLSTISAIIFAQMINLQQYFPEDQREIMTLLFPKISNIMGFLFFITGTIFILVTAKIVLKPIKSLSECSKEVSSGNFDVKAKSTTSNDELDLLITNFNSMVEQLSKNEYLHKDFVSNLSHEYKTPLTAIQGYAEILNTCELTENQVREYAKNILDQSVRLSNLSHELLRLSEIDNKPTNFIKTEYNLDAQIREVIITLQKKWEEKNIELDIELDEIKFLGDKELMFHAFSNLIENSIKYSNENGFIKISLFKKENIVFIIEDNGVGIEEEKLSKIFERFYQADESLKHKGSGLGLSIVSKVIELHNGKIEVSSKIAQGTKFIITF